MNEIDWSDCPAVWRDPMRMGGQWCFDQTRLPIRLLFANLAEGVSVEQFCEWHPPVTRAQCEEVLAWIAQTLAAAEVDSREPALAG